MNEVFQSPQLLDLQGLKCPEPLMMLRQTLRGLDPGALLKVLTTDPSTKRDFTNFCQFIGHEMIACESRSATTDSESPKADVQLFEFLIRKGT